MRFSAGKGTRMKHSTGVNMKKLAELKRRKRALRHSTGEKSPLGHATGKEFDYKVSYETLLEEDEKGQLASWRFSQGSASKRKVGKYVRNYRGKMGIKYSTGRGTRLRHSTAMEWKDLEKAKKKYDPVRHSTGETSSIKHATGTEFDYKVLSKQLEKEETIELSGLPSKVRSKTKTEPHAYLEEFHKLTKNRKYQGMRVG